MGKFRRRTLKTKQVRTKKMVCNVIIKAIQKKVLKKWVTIKKYEVEVWEEK